MLDRTPIIFISYSWTSKEYQETVIQLASRIRHDGVDVKLDVWDLLDGQDKYVFMEQCVNNPDIDKVLILSDKRYAEKADNRDGGVGDETAIITPEVYGKENQNKFIPVVMERDKDGKEFLPAYLKSRKYRDLSGANYETEYQELLRTIYDAPLHRKPEIGQRPKWLTEDEPDEVFQIKDAGRRIAVSELGSQKYVAIQDFIDMYIESLKQFYKEGIDNDTYLKNFIAMKEYRNVFLDQLSSFNSHNLGDMMSDQFERLYNALFDIKTFGEDKMSCYNEDFDLFRVHIWELFVCTVAFMLHYEMYKDINELLTRTYYIRTSPLGENLIETSYEGFRFHSTMIDERIKESIDGELSRKYTLLGHYVYNEREYKPIYSGRSLANADLFLYQVYNGLDLEKITQYYGWFPTMYIYSDGNSSIWKKLKSKRFCEKIKAVFGASSIDELKDRISNCIHDQNYHYSGAWPGAATAILDLIKLEDIATLP